MRCLRCNRKLSDAVSVKLRIGPICRQRQEEEGKSLVKQLDLPFPVPKTYFGLESLKLQHERVCKILLRRSVVTDRE